MIRSTLPSLAILCLPWLLSPGCQQADVDLQPRVGLYAMGRDPEEDLAAAAKDGSYRFLVAGHVYGRHGVSHGLFRPLRDSWGRLKSPDRPDFAVLTGDVVSSCKSSLLDELDKDLEYFEVPAYIAPGNHDGRIDDLGNSVLQKRYGARSKSWRIGEDVFLCCDTVKQGGNIDGDDLASLRRLCATKPRTVFIFVHHLVWVDCRDTKKPEIKGLVNSIAAGYAKEGNFKEVVLPIIESSGAQVFVFAGDVGAGSQVVEWQDEIRPGVHLMASGMGEHPHVGTYLLIDVTPKGVRVSSVSLNDDQSRILRQAKPGSK